MGRFFYDTGIRTMHLGIQIASLFNKKAQLWVKGRKNWRKPLKEKVAQLPQDKKSVWFHVSSLGEFEQGRPVIEELKNNNDVNIIISFYSPSGYEVMKEWSFADLICYLPLDTKKNAKDFVKLVNPSLVVFVKYEFWYHYLSELKKIKVPAILISARFYPSQDFFKSWMPWLKNLVFLFKEILVQDQLSKDLLDSIGYQNALISGDSRYDRVSELAEHTDNFDEIEKFISNRKVFIAGSTWPSDEKILLQYIKENESNYCFLLAPHDIKKEHIFALKQKLGNDAVLYSDISQSKNEKTLIIDCVGILSRIYKYADIAYVGGAFKEGLHNILEPASYGVPVITGPDHSGFPEGPAMEENGGLIRVSSYQELKSCADQLIMNNETRNKRAQANKAFISERKGASKKIIKELERYLKN